MSSWTERWRAMRSRRKNDGDNDAVQSDHAPESTLYITDVLGPDTDRTVFEVSVLLAAERERAAELERLAAQFKETTHNPEFLTAFFQRLWTIRQKQAGNEVLAGPLGPIESCPYTQEQIDQISEEGRRIGYIPHDLATDKKLPYLAAVFPSMHPSGISLNSISNELNSSGWFDYDASENTPNTYTNETELRNLFASRGRDGMNLNQYIVASQDSKLLTGKYLEERRELNRLLGSSVNGNVIAGRFDTSGKLSLRIATNIVNNRTGGRSVKAA